jgi:serine/threonine-protein kinase
MVTASGQVKLLDFGIAKVLDVTSASAEAATLTRMGWRMLTPEYAAPEQLRGEPASTATDVYALGVLLHELLTGERPARGGKDATAPQRPSSTIGSAAAALRGGSTERLQRVLQGDLDTIVRKAMHADQALRYGSAQGLAEDLQRYLDGQPVHAQPDSAWYRTRRFVARHRWGVAAAAAIALSLTAGALVATWQALVAKTQTIEAQKQARRAEQARDFLVKIISQADPYAWRDSKEPTVGELLEAGTRLADEELGDTPALHAEILVALGNAYESRGDLDRAEKLMRRSLRERRELFGEEHEAYADSLYQLSSVLYAKGDWKGSQDATTRAAAIFERTLGDAPKTALAYEGMASALEMGSDIDGALRLRRRALDIYRRNFGERDARTAGAEQSLGLVLLDERDKGAEGKALLDHALETIRQIDGPRSLRYANGLSDYAVGLQGAGDAPRAAETYRSAIAIYREFGAKDLLETPLGNLGLTYQRLGRFDDAERSMRETLALSKAGPKAGTRGEGRWLLGLADVLREAGKLDEAEPLMQQAVAIMERDAGPDHAFLPESLWRLADLRYEQGRFAEALALATRVDALLQRQAGPDDFRVALNQGLMARVRAAMGEQARGRELMASAMRSLRRARGADWASTSSVAGYVAEMQLQSGDAQLAEAGFRTLAEAFDASGKRAKAIEAHMHHGAALAVQDRPACEPVLRKALSQRRAMYGDNNARTGEARLYLGVCLLKRGQHAEGRGLIERGRGEFVRQFGGKHFVVRLADEQLGSG